MINQIVYPPLTCTDRRSRNNVIYARPVLLFRPVHGEGVTTDKMAYSDGEIVGIVIGSLFAAMFGCLFLVGCISCCCSCFTAFLRMDGQKRDYSQVGARVIGVSVTRPVELDA